MTIVLPICFRPGNRRDHSCSAGRKGGWSFSHFVTQESWVAPFVFRHGHEPSTQGPLRDDSKRSPRRALFLKRRLEQLGRSDSAPVSVHIGLLIHGCLARVCGYGLGVMPAAVALFTVVSRPCRLLPRTMAGYVPQSRRISVFFQFRANKETRYDVYR